MRLECLDSKKEKHVEYVLPEDLANKKFRDENTGDDMEKLSEDALPLIEWLADNYKRFGASL